MVVLIYNIFSSPKIIPEVKCQWCVSSSEASIHSVHTDSVTASLSSEAALLETQTAGGQNVFTRLSNLRNAITITDLLSGQNSVRVDYLKGTQEENRCSLYLLGLLLVTCQV